MLWNRTSHKKSRYLIALTKSDRQDVEGTVKGVINFFGDFEPKSIGDTDEDKIYWYTKVNLTTTVH